MELGERSAMKPKYTRITDTSAAEKLVKLAKEDKRSEGLEVAWLIEKEWNRRHPLPLPCDTFGIANTVLAFDQEEVQA
jgi:hypothetical protein